MKSIVNGIAWAVVGGISACLGAAYAGEVIFAGRKLAGMSRDELAALRNEKIGYIFQSHHLLPQCTALENVLVPTLVSGDAKGRAATLDRARVLLEKVGLGDRLAHRPAHLSGGECQRVAVVRALINQPLIVLADEPTGSLDEKAADHLGELLCELNESESVAMVMVTHSQRLAARMRRICELHLGELRPSEVGA